VQSGVSGPGSVHYWVGIYGHPVPDDLSGVFGSVEVDETPTTEALHFISVYSAKAALWLRGLGLSPP
jgi:hypothetical protein